MSAPGLTNNPGYFLLGSGLLVLWGSVDGNSVEEEPLNDWWTNEHLPERLSISGFNRARRYYTADTSSPAKSHYLTLYEVASVATLVSTDYMTKLNEPTHGTQKWMPTMASMNRAACSVLVSIPRTDFRDRKSAVGATIAHIVFPGPKDVEDEQQLSDWVVNQFTQVMLAHKTVLAVHLVQQDDHATRSGSSSKSYDAVRFQSGDAAAASLDENLPRYILLVEFASAVSGSLARKDRELVAMIVEGLPYNGTNVGSIWWEIYQLICAAST